MRTKKMVRVIRKIMLVKESEEPKSSKEIMNLHTNKLPKLLESISDVINNHNKVVILKTKATDL